MFPLRTTTTERNRSRRGRNKQSIVPIPRGLTTSLQGPFWTGTPLRQPPRVRDNNLTHPPLINVPSPTQHFRSFQTTQSNQGFATHRFEEVVTLNHTTNMGGMNPSISSVPFDTNQGNLLFGEQRNTPSVDLEGTLLPSSISCDHPSRHDQLVHRSMGGPLQSVSSIFPDVARSDSSAVPDSVINTTSIPISYFNDDKASASSNMGGLNFTPKSKNPACNNSLPPQVETVNSDEQRDIWRAKGVNDFMEEVKLQGYDLVKV